MHNNPIEEEDDDDDGTFILWKCLEMKIIQIEVSGLGTAGRAVASKTRGPEFDNFEKYFYRWAILKKVHFYLTN